jgi:hypothetical protein
MLKTKFHACGWLFYELPNLLCCFFSAPKDFRHVFMDHPKHPKICCAKWVFKFLFFIVTAVLIGYTKWENSSEVDEE